MINEYEFIVMSGPPPEGGVCDFCSSPDVHWAYPCRSHSVYEGDIEHHSAGGWAACPACHALIQRGDRERLARRSAKRVLRTDRMQMSLRVAIGLCRTAQDAFWANREGAPVPTTRKLPDPT